MWIIINDYQIKREPPIEDLRDGPGKLEWINQEYIYFYEYIF
jgi:hypothetical protein